MPTKTAADRSYVLSACLNTLASQPFARLKVCAPAKGNQAQCWPDTSGTFANSRSFQSSPYNISNPGGETSLLFVPVKVGASHPDFQSSASARRMSSPVVVGRSGQSLAGKLSASLRSREDPKSASRVFAE